MQGCAFAGCPLPGTKVCGNCKVARYCSVEHQKLCWPVHRGDCTKAKRETALAPINETERINTLLSRLSPEKWNLSLSRLRDTGLAEVARTLSHRSCTWLDLSCNDISSQGAAALILEIQKQRTALNYLDLSANPLIGKSKDGVASACCAALATYLKNPQCQLKTLDLHAAGVDDLGVSAIAQSLMENESLTSLNLRANYITDSGGKTLMTCLEKNQKLLSINLYCNDFTTEGITYLERAMGAHRSLRDYGQPQGDLEDSCPVS